MTEKEKTFHDGYILGFNAGKKEGHPNAEINREKKVKARCLKLLNNPVSDEMSNLIIQITNLLKKHDSEMNAVEQRGYNRGVKHTEMKYADVQKAMDEEYSRGFKYGVENRASFKMNFPGKANNDAS